MYGFVFYLEWKLPPGYRHLESDVVSCSLKGFTVPSRLNSFRLTEFRTNVICPKTAYIRQSSANSYQLCWRYLRISELIWSEAHVRPSCWSSEANCHWRRGGKWEWHQRDDHNGFEVDWGACRWHQGVWGQWCNNQRESKNETRNCEDYCFLWGDEEEEASVWLEFDVFFLKPSSETRV